MIGRLYGLPSAERRRRANDVVERIRLVEVADRPVKGYSGGMRRRLDLAASLVGRPEVLFLDEPTTGLDPASRRDVWDLVRGLVDVGSTVLLTTQYLEEADELADQITVVDAGRVVGKGTSDELKATVGGATVELDVADADRGRALDAVRGLDSYASGATIHLPAVRGVETLREVLRRLDDHRITPEDIALRKPTLDDVFLALTGHATTGPATTGPTTTGPTTTNGKAA